MQNYYVYNYSTESYSYLGGYDDLIRFVARVVSIPWYFSHKHLNKKECYKDIDFSGNDKSVVREYHRDAEGNISTVVHEMKKKYLFLTADGAIVDVRVFHADIERAFIARFERTVSPYKPNLLGDCKYNDDCFVRGWRGPDIHFKFRNGPVPYIRHYGGGPYAKNARLKQRLVESLSPDLAEYMRPRRKLKEIDWDGRYRHRERNWKSQRKVRHQWEK